MVLNLRFYQFLHNWVNHDDWVFVVLIQPQNLVWMMFVHVNVPLVLRNMVWNWIHVFWVSSTCSSWIYGENPLFDFHLLCFFSRLGSRAKKQNPCGWDKPISKIRACLANKKFIKKKNAFCVFKACLPNKALDNF